MGVRRMRRPHQQLTDGLADCLADDLGDGSISDVVADVSADTPPTLGPTAYPTSAPTPEPTLSLCTVIGSAAEAAPAHVFIASMARALGGVVKPEDVVVFAIVRAGRAMEASVGVLSAMCQVRVVPNTITSLTAISACERVMLPNTIASSAAICACVNGVQWKLALELMNVKRLHKNFHL